MAHWMQPSSDVRGQLTDIFGSNDNVCNIKHQFVMTQAGIGSDFLGSGKYIGEIKTRTFEIMNRSLSERNLRDEEQSCQIFPEAAACRRSQSWSDLCKGEEISGLEASIPLAGGNVEVSRVNHAMAASCPRAVEAAEISSRGGHSQPKFQKPQEQVKVHAFFSESSFGLSKPLQGVSPGPVPDIMSYRSFNGSNRFESGRTEISSFMEAPVLSLNDQFHGNKVKMSETGKLLRPWSRQNIMSFLPNDPSASEYRSPEFGPENLKLQNSYGFRLLQFPHQGHPPQLTRSESLHNGYYSRQKLPTSVQDVKTMRISTGLDSAVGSSAGYSSFSQRTRTLLITKNPDVSLDAERETITKFGVASELNGNPCLNLWSPSPFFSYRNQGVKIQSLGSSTDSEGKENIEDTKASNVILRNESSVETDIMDIDAFTEKYHLSGVNSTPLDKGIKMDVGPSQFSVDSSGIKIGCKPVNTKLPDMNLEFCALPAGRDSKDIAEPSSSKTQSLDLDLLLGHAEHTNNSIADHCPDDPPDPDPTERWIKRLKLSALDTIGRGTQISQMEDFSREKVNMLFNTSIAEPEECKGCGKELMEPSKTATLLRNGESSSMATTRRGRDLLLSQPWFVRWLHNQAGSQQKETEVLLHSEQQDSKLGMDDFQKDQFPSVAAMALMGKAMNGFPPCHIEKRESFLSWKSKEV